MVEVDFNEHTYICPFCGKEQAFDGSHDTTTTGYRLGFSIRDKNDAEQDFEIHHFMCNNKNCQKITVLAIHRETKKQFDIVPEFTAKQYPEYIPQQIRIDYLEGVSIINKSAKAAATMFRRCLQGMIRDFYGIRKTRLIDEIEELKEKIPVTQWKAIDATRKIGNIGAHMEKDINLIIDVDPNEANYLKKLIELLIDKWYIARHDEEILYNDIILTSDIKQGKRENN